MIKGLIDALNYHPNHPGITKGSVYARAQEELQRLTSHYSCPSNITDETVQNLYNQCHGILESYGINGFDYPAKQIWRGMMCKYICLRHRNVFDTYNIIPEFCFSCYKVLIEPQTVVELFKLMLIFNDITLPLDNTRKCIVEVRPEIPGTYKGLIYCQDLAQANEIMEFTGKIIRNRISKDIPVSIKRGCSEYVAAFPEFASFGDKSQVKMTYNEEWREYEHKTDRTFFGHITHDWSDTHNHKGFTLNDALIMQVWLSYAASKDDLTHLKISRALSE